MKKATVVTLAVENIQSFVDSMESLKDYISHLESWVDDAEIRSCLDPTVIHGLDQDLAALRRIQSQIWKFLKDG